MSDAAHPIELSEEWLAEWVAYGLGEIAYYLLKQARFQSWCLKNDRE